jgi:MFS family permease
VLRPGSIIGSLGAVARNDSLPRVELAWGAAVAAEWAHFVALGVFAFEGGGAGAVGVAGLVRLLPAALAAPVAATPGARFPRERFLLALSLVWACALGGSALAALAGSRTAVFALAAVVGLCSTLARPALQAFLPSLARTPEELIAANGASSTVESLGTLVGPLLAGALVSVSGVEVVFGAGAGLLLAAAAVLVGVRAEGAVRLGAPAQPAVASRAVAEGFVAIARSPRARLLVGLIVAQTFVRGLLNVLIVVAVYRILDGGAAEVGYLTAAVGVGGLLGAVGAIGLAGRGLAVRFGLALIFWGAPIMLVAPRPYFVLAVVLLAVVGAANSVEDVAVFTLLQRMVPDEVLTRVLGVVWGLAMGGVAVGSFAAPLLIDAAGTRVAFLVVGAILPLLALLTYHRLIEIDRSVAPTPQLGLVEGSELFAPLSIAAKERVAANLEPVLVPADVAVIRAGEAGDRFYLVDDGELRIEAAGVDSVARAGGSFGEIALLRDVPRTATVTAAVDSRLYALSRADFLAVVTGHEGVRAAGEAVADARLSPQAG